MADKKGFASRLKQAMRSAGYVPRPAVLEREFNARYYGNPVSLQAARYWLNGRSVPTQEKLEVLADWLGVDAHVLRYGGQPLREKSGIYLQLRKEISAQDREAIEDFLNLHSTRRKLIREFIAQMSELGAPKPTGKSSGESSARSTSGRRKR